MPHPLALFSLRPLNERAQQVVAHPCNSHLVSFSNHHQVWVLDVGHVRSASGDVSTLATLGRGGDILVDGSNISKIQCSFEIDRETNVVMFYDRSHSQTSQVFGENAAPFVYHRPRKVVVQEGLNTIIGMGGVNSNLVMFKLDWHCTAKEMPLKVKERQSRPAGLQDNPRLAQTLVVPNTLAPSRMKTRIHTPGPRRLGIEWRQIGDPIGKGHFATVYKALDVYTGKIMAVKVMPLPESRGGYDRWTDLKDEIEILSSISHSHVVEYISSQGWGCGVAEIFMELKEGTLRSLVCGGCSVSLRDLATTAFHHMLQALDFLSTRGIIHRDLKPENILYTTRQDGFHFQLGDFGNSNREKHEDKFAGTAIFMSPEIYYEFPWQTPKADVWSLFATLLWTLDTGGFRRLEAGYRDYDDIQSTVQSLAEAPEMAPTREMARSSAQTRASAAQMLVRLFDGKGLTTPRSQVHPL
ncbi:uncharacterized protein THITE_2048148, partial [Thermothielavioides terrestris NRRL 8126]